MHFDDTFNHQPLQDDYINIQLPFILFFTVHTVSLCYQQT